MPLANGRHYCAIPGPSVIPDRVLQAMHRAAPDIYAGPLIEMTDTLIPDLRAVARTRHQVAIYIGNGHAAWEAALCNTLSPGDKVLVLSTGQFAQGWAAMARALGVNCETIGFGKRRPVVTDRVAEALSDDKGHAYKAVLAVHTDTSTSLRSDIGNIRAAMDDVGHPALLMVDCIASLCCDPFEMDAWGVDVMLAGSQKGLMTPPGLCFIFFDDKADIAREHAACVTNYWDWRPRVAPEQYFQYFCGTAPIHHLYGLREALTMILEEGVENIWARHATLARAIWASFDAWGREGPIELNVSDPGHRSHAVTSVRIGAPHGTALREWVKEQAGVTLGVGLGMAPPDDPAWHGFFRVGHMGHVNAQMIMGVLGAIDAGLKALEIPHGGGALEAASAMISRHRDLV
ncbi:MAG: aminotransferase class V-fold PLP-dependent enzyme [Pseudomonadota bacterium]